MNENTDRTDARKPIIRKPAPKVYLTPEEVGAVKDAIGAVLADGTDRPYRSLSETSDWHLIDPTWNTPDANVVGVEAFVCWDNPEMQDRFAVELLVDGYVVLKVDPQLWSMLVLHVAIAVAAGRTDVALRITGRTKGLKARETLCTLDVREENWPAAHGVLAAIAAFSKGLSLDTNTILFEGFDEDV